MTGIGLRCELPIADRIDGQACARWDTHDGPCLAYPQVMWWVLNQCAQLQGYNDLDSVPDTTVGMWVVRASFKYKTMVVNRNEIEENQ